jgi:hypothetical protein
MKTDFVLFGKRFNMASQSRRRRLVALVYAGFAVLIAAGWSLDRWRLWGAMLIILPAPYVARNVFGGFGPGDKGIIKPFLGNEVRARYLANPGSRWSRMALQTIPKIADPHEFSSDEREIHGRNTAHEVAYRRLGMVAIFTLSIAFLKNGTASILQRIGAPLSNAFFDQVIYGLLFVTFILTLTLPQAILLWTEPDMEEPQ